MNVDVLVVGGGPVGLASAIEAKLAGLSVVVLEPRPGPIDKACGEGLMPGAVAALERLGVHPCGHPLRGIAYVDGTRRAEHRFRHRSGLGVRRTTLHDALARRATELGVVVVPERVRRIAQDGEGVTACGLRGRWLLGCDGLHSTVRRLAGLEEPGGRGRHAAPRGRPSGSALRGPKSTGAARRRFGMRRHFRAAPWGDLVEVHWGERCEAYVTPVGDHLVGIALLGPPGMDFEDELAALPELSTRLRGAEADGPVRGAGPLRQRTTSRTAGRVLLVGDASGYVDALTGEGIRVGLAQAAAAVAGISSGDPRGYERAWSAATRDFRMLTGGLVRAATSPLRAGIVPAAVTLPSLYGAVVERLAR